MHRGPVAGLLRSRYTLSVLPTCGYVDKSEEAARFFAHQQSILGYINRHKNYKRSAYLRFIQQDYLESLPLREATFDLLLVLFAAGISRSCKRFVKQGGLIISNNHQDDAQEAAREDDLALISIIQLKGGQYVSAEGGIDAIEIPVQTSHKNALRQRGRSVEYIDHETYYVFERRF